MITLIEYSEKYFDAWNKFVNQSNNGTIFHRLDFLEYHGKKFKNQECHLIWLKGEAIFAVMPLAISESGGHKVAKSPFGGSFGGLVYGKKFTLKESVEVFDLFTNFLKTNEVNEVLITLQPACYSTNISQHFEYLMSRYGFNIKSRDIFNVIPLKDSYEEVWSENFEGRARTAIKKSKSLFNIHLDASPEEFYPILLEDKKRHNNAVPSHTLEELRWLKSKFPEELFFDIAVLKSNGAKAGICYFKCNSRVMMTFYMSQQDSALNSNGTNVLLEHGLMRALKMKVQFLDFGGSTVGYNIANIGVARFKEGFGSSGYLRDTYNLK